METKNITIIVRGTVGETMKAIFDGAGKCISGDAEGVMAAVNAAMGKTAKPAAEPKETKEPKKGKNK